MRLRYWLQFMRAQTAPYTILLMLVPYVVAGGCILHIPLIIFLGFLLHLSSFGHNSLTDWLAGYDLADPSKRHHPHIRGLISKREAIVATYSLILVSFIGTGLYLYIADAPPITWLLFTIYIVSGASYNGGMNKNIPYSYSLASLSYTSLLGTWYTVARRELDMVGSLLMLWCFLSGFYQGWCGYVKDLWNPSEVNPIRKYAVYHGNVIMISKKVSLAYALLRLIVCTAVLSYVIYLLNDLVAAGFFLLMTAVLTWAMIDYHRYTLEIMDRHKLMEHIGLVEAIETLRLATLLGIWFIPVFTLSIYYFVRMNQYLWGSRFGPRV